MNYLAHLALSNDNSEVMLGNFIGDSIKGSDYSRYSPNVRRGILLHRKIDDFTDNHPVVRSSVEILKPTHGRYAGVVVDIFYDHFLATQWDEIHPAQPLGKFVSRVHRILMRNYFRLPGEVKRMLPFLIKSRRLENYGNMNGIMRALDIMSRNTSLPSNTQDAMNVLRENYEVFRGQFNEFYLEVEAMVALELEGVNSDAKR